MKKFLIVILSVFALAISNAQEAQIAKEYFDNGEFEKALISYNKLLEKQPGNNDYFLKVIEIHHQLEQNNVARTMLIEKISKSRNPQYLVELGYNYERSNDSIKAKDYYDKSLLAIEDNPVYTYYVAKRFEDHAIIDYAALAYEKGMRLKPELNYHIQLARIYGELGKVDKMFDNYLTYLNKVPTHGSYIQRLISEYVTEDATNEHNIIFRKVLLKKIQTEPAVLWNELLSWLFIQQKEYNKAFSQEKAIYRRMQESLQGVLDLADITIDEGANETAHEILDYIIETAVNPETVVEAQRKKIELTLTETSVKDYKEIDAAYKEQLDIYGRYPQTLDLQLSYAQFLAFYYNKPNEAISFLKEGITPSLSPINQARLKLKLGDILVFQERFNEALIYYTQIQRSVKNSTIAQEARFKVAKASFYKGDFDWAESQLKILKSSTSQLIANDALDLKLLISDNKFEDSTQVALKKYAKADLLAYQKKNKEAITVLSDVLENHKTESIIDQALFKQALLFEEEKDYVNAEANYQSIIANYAEDILIDDAYYRLAELYVNELNNEERAQYLYEQIIFNHADSIHYVEARKKYRKLRGDDIN